VAEGESTVYVYGVLSAPDRGTLSVAGVEGADVRIVESAGLAALVSDMQGGELAVGREVRAHWRVVEAASEHATVIPVRFGTVMDNDRAVRERLLEPNAERLTRLLRELAGRVQLIVKADYDEERMLRKVVRGSSDVAALRQRTRSIPEAAGYYERIRLGELVAAELERRREEDARAAVEALEPLAVAVRSEPAAGPTAAFNLAFLIERDKVDAFSDAVRTIAERAGDRMSIRYVGPVAPYSFAEADLPAESAVWG
jgi:hypothetical protein